MATVALVVVACASSTTSGPSGSLPPASGLSVPLSTASAPPSTGAGYDVPTPEPVNSVAVPEVPCPTTFALPTETLPPLPKTMTATVTPAVAGRVTYYGNGTLTVLGPKDWHCEASVGIDGSGRMTITPPGQPARSGSPAPTGSILTSPRQEVYGQALTAASAGPCVGCVVAMACGLFPEALNLMAQPGLACSSAPPAGEQVTRPQPRSAVFMDPPGVAGTGDPSGGAYRAFGFLVFDPGAAAGGSGRSAPSALKMTCTLPDALAPICDELVEGVGRGQTTAGG